MTSPALDTHPGPPRPPQPPTPPPRPGVAHVFRLTPTHIQVRTPDLAVPAGGRLLADARCHGGRWTVQFRDQFYVGLSQAQAWELLAERYELAEAVMAT